MAHSARKLRLVCTAGTVEGKQNWGGGGGGSCNWSIYKKVFASTYQDQKLGFADANDPLAPHPNPGSKCPPCPQLVPPALHYAQAFTTSI